MRSHRRVSSMHVQTMLSSHIIFLKGNETLLISIKNVEVGLREHKAVRRVYQQPSRMLGADE